MCDVCPLQLTAVLGRPPGANALPLPAKACPALCSLGHEQFWDLTSCARLSPEPSGRDLAKLSVLATDAHVVVLFIARRLVIVACGRHNMRQRESRPVM